MVDPPSRVCYSYPSSRVSATCLLFVRPGAVCVWWGRLFTRNCLVNAGKIAGGESRRGCKAYARGKLQAEYMCCVKLGQYAQCLTHMQARQRQSRGSDLMLSNFPRSGR